MTRSAVYACLCLLTLVFQTSVLSSWPEPYRLLSLPLILGIIILHERSLVLGTLWLAIFGLILELRGLGPGYAVAGLVSAGAALSLVVSVFAKRSLWALLGLTAITTLVYGLTRLLWLMLVSLVKEQTFNLGAILPSLEETLISVVLSVLTVFIFGVYVRRLVTWFRQRFVTSERREYEISFPKT